MRGDRPCIALSERISLPFTPHARGSTRSLGGGMVLKCVYPACAGIDPRPASAWLAHARLPRMRGDRPSPARMLSTLGRFTPHARGSTCRTHLNRFHVLVYPACAGIDLQMVRILRQPQSLPRMRGDRPLICYGCGKATKFTPHARGSTSLLF